MAESSESSEDQFGEYGCILENPYLGIPLKIPTLTLAPDHPLGAHLEFEQTFGRIDEFRAVDLANIIPAFVKWGCAEDVEGNL